MEKYQCQLCNKHFEGMKVHLRRTHLMSEEEYFELFPNELEIYNTYRTEVVAPKLKERSPNSIHFYLKKGLSLEDAQQALSEYNDKNPFRKKENAKCNKEYWLKRGYNEEEIPELIRKTYSFSEKDLINRHGEEKGKIKFEKWYNSLLTRAQTEIINICNQQNVSEEQAIFIRNKRKRECSPRTLDYWLKMGYDEETALEKRSKYQSLNVEKFLRYKIDKGYSLEEAQDLLKQKVDSCSIYAIVKRYKCSLEEAIEIQEKIKRFDTRVVKGISVSLEKRTELEQYSFNVWRETNMNWRIYQDFINPENIKRGKKYHLDHKYSIIQGFLDNIDYKIIGSPINLEIIPGSENCKKQGKCSIEKQQLIEDFKKFKHTTDRIIYV